jgi:hypothetical protein
MQLKIRMGYKMGYILPTITTNPRYYGDLKPPPYIEWE